MRGWVHAPGPGPVPDVMAVGVGLAPSSRHTPESRKALLRSWNERGREGKGLWSCVVKMRVFPSVSSLGAAWSCCQTRLRRLWAGVDLCSSSMLVRTSVSRTVTVGLFNLLTPACSRVRARACLQPSVSWSPGGCGAAGYLIPSASVSSSLQGWVSLVSYS